MLTLGKVRVVIDTSLKRMQAYDPRRRMACLQTQWVSHAAVRRAGLEHSERRFRHIKTYRTIVAGMTDPSTISHRLAQAI